MTTYAYAPAWVMTAIDSKLYHGRRVNRSSGCHCVSLSPCTWEMSVDAERTFLLVLGCCDCMLRMLSYLERDDLATHRHDQRARMLRRLLLFLPHQHLVWPCLIVAKLGHVIESVSTSQPNKAASRALVAGGRRENAPWLNPAAEEHSNTLSARGQAEMGRKGVGLFVLLRSVGDDWKISAQILLTRVNGSTCSWLQWSVGPFCVPTRYSWS